MRRPWYARNFVYTFTSRIHKFSIYHTDENMMYQSVDVRVMMKEHLHINFTEQSHTKKITTYTRKKHNSKFHSFVENFLKCVDTLMSVGNRCTMNIIWLICTFTLCIQNVSGACGFVFFVIFVCFWFDYNVRETFVDD